MWPEDGRFKREIYDDRSLKIIQKVRRVRDTSFDHGVALPFEDISSKRAMTG